MLDKVNKIINMQEKNFTWGQKSDGTWFCKEFKTDTIDEADGNINKINIMLNRYNKKDEKTKVKLKSKADGKK